MQDANHDDPAFRPGRGFGQFLEEVDIVANAQRGGLQEFAHLVNDDEDAFMLFGFGGFAQVRDQAGGRSLFSFIAEAQGLSHAARELMHNARPLADDGNGQPAFAARQRLVEHQMIVEAQDFASFRAQRLVGSQSARERHRQGGFPSAKRPGPSERPLIGVGDLPAHAVDDSRRGAMADVTIQCIRPAVIDVDADRALIVPRDADNVAEFVVRLSHTLFQAWIR